MWKPPTFMLILLAFGTSAAHAASFECDGLPTSPALARVVTKQARLNFVAGPGKRTPACPSAEGTCKLRAYVVPGDEVLVNATEQPYVCASFAASNGTETRGLLPRTALEVVPLGPASAEKWVGTWRRQEGLIEISRDKDRLKVSGNATYRGGTILSASGGAQLTLANSRAVAAPKGSSWPLVTIQTVRRFRPPIVRRSTTARRGSSSLVAIWWPRTTANAVA